MLWTAARFGPRLASIALLALVLLWHMPASANPTRSADHAAQLITAYTLDVVLEPEQRTLSGHAKIRLGDTHAVDLLLGRQFSMVAVHIDNREHKPRPVREGALTRWRIPAGAPNRNVTVRWRGELAPLRTTTRQQGIPGWREASSDARGSYLPASSFWYPVLARDGEGLKHSYRARIDVPEGQLGVVAGNLSAEDSVRARTRSEYVFDSPATGIDLIAGPYRRTQRAAQSIDGRPLTLHTLFHAEIEALSSDYLDSVAEYVALYEDWIGPYPYDSFSVVSSPTPTGLGLPTMTYIGTQVLALPFIRTSSLGHEVLHNWWGNGVYPDYARGNWSEGLTTFMADYHYAKRNDEGLAREMRLGWLRELSAIGSGVDQPLEAFTARHHGISQAVGYSKAAMLFVMLRDRIGEDAFDRAVRRFWRDHRFRVADWHALRSSFEAESNEALGEFFDQWLTRRGLPTVALAAVETTADGVIVELAQTEPTYALDVPVRIDTATGTTTHVLRLAHASQRFELTLSGAVHRVSLDPDNRVLRRLGNREAPPILREIQFDPDPALLVLGDAQLQATAATLAKRLLERAPTQQVAAQPPGRRGLLVIGERHAINDWLARHDLPPAPEELSGHGDVRMWAQRLPSGAPLAIVSADNAAALDQAIRPLPHYRGQSWLIVERGRALARGVWPAATPYIDLMPPLKPIEGQSDPQPGSCLPIACAQTD